MNRVTRYLIALIVVAVAACIVNAQVNPPPEQQRDEVEQPVIFVVEDGDADAVTFDELSNFSMEDLIEMVPGASYDEASGEFRFKTGDNNDYTVVIRPSPQDPNIYLVTIESPKGVKDEMQFDLNDKSESLFERMKREFVKIFARDSDEVADEQEAASPSSQKASKPISISIGPGGVIMGGTNPSASSSPNDPSGTPEYDEAVSCLFSLTAKNCASSPSEYVKSNCKGNVCRHHHGHDQLYHLGPLSNRYKSFDKNWTLALDSYRLAASLGNASAQYMCGVLYQTGLRGHPVDPLASQMYLKAAANSGDHLAKMALGFAYLHGVNVIADCEKSTDYYRDVALDVTKQILTTGFLPVNTQQLAIYSHLLSPIKAEDIGERVSTEVYNYHEHMAARGDANSQAILGNLHLHGAHGVERDYDAARRYLQRAVQHGNPQAMNTLAFMHAHGLGVERNPAQAFRLFKAAADVNDPDALNAVGSFYLKGNKEANVEENATLALYYIKSAAEKGQVDAIVKLGSIYYEGIGVARDYNKAYAYFREAAFRGNVLGQFYLAMMYENGQGTSQSCSSAVVLFKGVSERGHWTDDMSKAYDMWSTSNVMSPWSLMTGRSYKLDILVSVADRYAPYAVAGSRVGQLNTAWLMMQISKYFDDETVAHESAVPIVDTWRIVADDNNVSKVTVADMWNRVLHGGLGQSYMKGCQRLYEYAALQGDAEAYSRLGDIYYHVHSDYTNALDMYKIASKKRDASALYSLGTMYEWGRGTVQDFHLAKRYFDDAMFTGTAPQVAMYPTEAVMFVHWGLHLVKYYVTGWLFGFQPLSAPDQEMTIHTSIPDTEGEYGKDFEYTLQQRNAKAANVDEQANYDEEEYDDLTDLDDDMIWLLLIAFWGLLVIAFVAQNLYVMYCTTS